MHDYFNGIALIIVFICYLIVGIQNNSTAKKIREYQEEIKKLSNEFDILIKVLQTDKGCLLNKL
jgi:uncharacterized protein YoxC